ncbi:MAG: hypothetical protein WAW61_16040 [Methylococcaceae bacterium]
MTATSWVLSAVALSMVSCVVIDYGLTFEFRGAMPLHRVASSEAMGWSLQVKCELRAEKDCLITINDLRMTKTKSLFAN